jgi:hypothetical protein
LNFLHGAASWDVLAAPRFFSMMAEAPRKNLTSACQKHDPKMMEFCHLVAANQIRAANLSVRIKARSLNI